MEAEQEVLAPNTQKKTLYKKTKKTTTAILEEEVEEDIPIGSLEGSLNATIMTAIQGLLQQEIGGFQAQLDTLQLQQSNVIAISSAKESPSDDDNNDEEGENRSSNIDYNSPAPPLKRSQPSQLSPRALSTRKGKGTHSDRLLHSK
ncbi:hypothetical protein EJ02DRAFT_425375 [Clathrospora elynae]|uniref:Uncharacterized protein n=1 Tax=Clathrospora elynae TaxID=706981 RepID=A0A6A5SHK5_9PLEO|nr:hypothetical protein EJ02DRAFT_425375 [Clathrospora elynae]